MAGTETLPNRELLDFEALVRSGADALAREREFTDAVSGMNMEETKTCFEVAYRARRDGVHLSEGAAPTTEETGLIKAETAVRSHLYSLIAADARERDIDVSMYTGRGMPYDDYAYYEVHKIIKAINEHDGLVDVPFR